MTAPGVEIVLSVLESSGFERLPTPLVVAGAKFDFDAAVKGTGVSHDLVVVATSTTAADRLIRLLSSLSRTLDQVESRRPVTLVLLGDSPGLAVLRNLERHVRVLPIQDDIPTHDEVQRAIAVLMPLTLPAPQSPTDAPLASVARLLGASRTGEHQAFLDAAPLGPDEVRTTLRHYIDAAIADDLDEVGDS